MKRNANKGQRQNLRRSRLPVREVRVTPRPKPEVKRTEAMVEARRETVAALSIRGISQRNIMWVLAQRGMVNPKTGEPWSVATINRDLQVIRKEWRERRFQAVDDWVSEETVKLDELERQVWANAMSAKNTDGYSIGTITGLVLDIQRRRAQLLGLDAMTRSRVQLHNMILLSDDAMAAVRALGLDMSDVAAEFEQLIQEIASQKVS